MTQKITHEMIGRFTEEDGLIPKGIKKTKEKKPFPLIIRIGEYEHPTICR